MFTPKSWRYSVILPHTIFSPLIRPRPFFDVSRDGGFFVDAGHKLYYSTFMHTLLKILSKDQFGFVLSEDLKHLEEHIPKLPLLMRFGFDRLVRNAEDVRSAIELNESNGDYLRDISIAVQTLDEMLLCPFVEAEVKSAIKSFRAF